MHRILPILFVLLLISCGGKETAGAGADAKPGVPAVDAAAAQPLTCSSLAFCTSYEYRDYLIGTVPTATGGTISDGQYRASWRLIPDNVGSTAGFSNKTSILEFRGRSYNWAGFFQDEVGTFNVSGSDLVMSATQKCSQGAEGSKYNPPDVATFKFTAIGNQVTIYSRITSGSKQWDEATVYEKISPQDFCSTSDPTPTTPGPSVNCQVSNCYCASAVNNTLADSSCGN
jgi:hypothetical protein